MDTLDALQQASTATEKIVAGVAPAQLSDSTPCTEWDVRQLLNHMLGSMELGAAVFSGTEPEHPTPPGGLPDVDLVGDDPAGTFRTASTAMLAGARTKGALDTTHTTPIGDMPGAVLGGILALDLFVHAWDLARATGQEAAWDQELAGHVHEFAQQTIQPEMRGAGKFVAPVVPVADDAPVMDRLLGFMGRTP